MQGNIDPKFKLFPFAWDFVSVALGFLHTYRAPIMSTGAYQKFEQFKQKAFFAIV